MKLWVWICRLMYGLLISSAVGFHVLKDTEPFYALASAAAGMFIVLPLTISCVTTNNQRRKRRVATVRHEAIEESQDFPQELVGAWRMVPAELASEPKWRYNKQLSHVVEGVSAF